MLRRLSLKLPVNPNSVHPKTTLLVLSPIVSPTVNPSPWSSPASSPRRTTNRSLTPRTDFYRPSETHSLMARCCFARSVSEFAFGHLVMFCREVPEVVAETYRLSGHKND